MHSLWFFYGTLRDSDVRSKVLSAQSKLSLYQPDFKLSGYHLRQVKGEDFPIVIETNDPRDLVVGDLFHGVSQEDQERLCYFEGEEYSVQTLTVDQLKLMCFLPNSGHFEVAGNWDYHEWRARTEEYTRYLERIEEYMAHFGLNDGIW